MCARFWGPRAVDNNYEPPPGRAGCPFIGRSAFSVSTEAILWKWKPKKRIGKSLSDAQLVLLITQKRGPNRIMAQIIFRLFR